VTLPRGPHCRLPANDRRTQLLDAALNLFSQKGFNGATTKEIAASAGVTEAIVFRHFPTKHALYEAVLESQTDYPRFKKWMDEARQCMDRSDDPGLFRAIAAATFENYRSDPRMERLMLFAALEGQEQALEHYRNASIPIYKPLCEYVSKRQREGAIAGDKPGVILTAIAGMANYHAVVTRLFGFQSGLSDDEAVEAFTRILMDGIIPRAPK
jgi:TetR/AcrR family transcriptional regulator